MPDENDNPLTEEELALAREGEALISAAVADVRAPQSLREAIERERERAAARARAPFWRRQRLGLASAGAAAAALAVVAIALETGGDPTEPSLAKVYAAARLDADQGRSAAASAARRPSSTPRSATWCSRTGKRSSAGRPSAVATTRSRGAPSRPSSIATPRGRGSATRSCPASPLGAEPPGRQVTRKGKTYHVTSAGGRTIVTWNQQGHTCVIVAPSEVPRARLVDLAASRNV